MGFDFDKFGLGQFDPPTTSLGESAMILMKQLMSWWWVCGMVVGGVDPAAAADKPVSLAENARRLATAHSARAASLPASVRGTIDRAKSTDADDAIIAALDPHTLLAITINPEGRVKVARGQAELTLFRGLPGYAVVKVTNQSRATPRLRPQAEFTGGEPSPFSVDFVPVPGAGPELTGEAVEYRLLAITCRDAGRWELTIGFDAGQGTQDIGFRGVVPILATVRERPPNIVLIVADDLGYGAVGCYGQKLVKTPNIDALAAGGTRFTQFYAGCCMCAPSRSVLMTGLHTGHTRVRANDPKQTLLAADVTVATRLKAAGYVCGGFGKWGLGDAGTPGAPEKHGFDEWVGYLGQVHAHFHYPDWVWKGGVRFPLPGNDPKTVTRQTYAPDVIHDAAIDFVQQNKDRPFFCYVPTTIPHAELLVPNDSLKEYDGLFPETPYIGDHYASNPKPRATYAGMVTRLDRDVGRLVAKIKALGLDRDTLVLFTSDNGPINAGGADPDYFRNSGPLRGLKFSLYEGGIRVPMIAAWPGRVPTNRVNDQPWAFEDFLPTACELAGTTPGANGDGVSVVPMLCGKDGQRERPYLYWESPGKDGMMQAVRAGNWKAIRPKLGSPFELYDLKADPAETTNVVSRHPDVVKRLVGFAAEAHTAPAK